LAGSDGRLRTFRAGDKVKVFEVAAENNPPITSVIADDNSVVFATEAGNVISIAPDEPEKVWQFDATGGIVGPIVKDGESLFLASKDTYVYQLDIRKEGFPFRDTMRNGARTPPVWKYQTEAILDKAPRVTREVVYQYVPNKGLTAINRKSGKFMWQVKNGLDLLAEAEGKAYVFKKEGELVVMDNSSKKRLYSVNFARVSRYAANVADSKIYIADKTGRIACLRPVE
jgi:outer membrane protein assembly factor BamB